jgi:hypothetical protein
VKSTRGKADDSGILRIDSPGYSGSGSLEEVSWEEFFEKFDREKLALVCQETTAGGQKSNFNKIEGVTARAAARRRKAGAQEHRRSQGGGAQAFRRRQKARAVDRP